MIHLAFLMYVFVLERLKIEQTKTEKSIYFKSY